jgi:hypothetical protein
LPDSLKAFDIEDSRASAIDIQELELKEKIAEGAYGVVWRAFHGRDVAIKVQSIPQDEYEQVNLLR